ncbi:MAG: efflux RND transporter periplasmic adaptor subunit, partial [Nitrobacter sp.]
MLSHPSFFWFHRYLPLALVVLPALALGGCNESVAEKAEPTRPVLTATVHFEAETPNRSFVGTIKPRIETDIGFRVP